MARRFAAGWGLAGASLALLCLTSPARAEPSGVLLIGPLASFGSHADGPASAGGGLEITYNHYPGGFGRAWLPLPEGPGFGGILQAQAVGDHMRFMTGLQVSDTCVGLELGPAIETGDHGYGDTLSVHLAPFFSLGLASVAVRFGLPLARLASAPAYGTDIAVVLTLKIPSIR